MPVGVLDLAKDENWGLVFFFDDFSLSLSLSLGGLKEGEKTTEKEVTGGLGENSLA